jgi:hypothetical protein
MVMRSLRFALLLAAAVFPMSPAQAGIYRTFEPPLLLPPLPAFEQTQKLLGELRKIPLPPKPNEPGYDPGSMQVEYWRRVGELEPRQRDRALSVVEQIDLAACYLRLRKALEAHAILHPLRESLPADHQSRFLVLLNLSMAEEALSSGNAPAERLYRLNKAISAEEEALKEWPAVWAGWDQNQRLWYRRAEQLRLALLRRRLREAEGGRPAAAGVEPRAVDALFPGFRFVGPSGQYEAGGLDREMWDKLPPEAAQLVLQLLVWSPSDEELYWLYGEMLNVFGQVDYAAAVLDELADPWRVWRKRAPEQFVQHREVLVKAARARRTLREKPSMAWLLLEALAPPPPLLTPLGGAAQQAAMLGWGQAQLEMERREKEGLLPQPPPQAQEPPPQAAPPPSWLPNWRHIAVGFIAGFLVAALAGLQLREWRRRTAGGAAQPQAPPAAETPAAEDARSSDAVTPPTG